MTGRDYGSSVKMMYDEKSNDLRESIQKRLTGLNWDQMDGCLGVFNNTWSEGVVKESLDCDWRSQLK